METTIDSTNNTTAIERTGLVQRRRGEAKTWRN